MVSKSSILLGANAEEVTQQLLINKQITNWQRLAPNHVNTTRIIIVVDGNDQDYNDALNGVIAAAADVRVAWRHEDYLTYGDPNNNVWMPPLA
ncbi:MAG TPA: hypothetical protein VMU41_01120 [Candidatus Binataceae bacterium]|nr:hypothetical protein [Candidatus Binataceae bacterium]